MSWRAQTRSKDAKTPSGSRGRSDKPEPDCCPIQQYVRALGSPLCPLGHLFSAGGPSGEGNMQSTGGSLTYAHRKRKVRISGSHVGRAPSTTEHVRDRAIIMASALGALQPVRAVDSALTAQCLLLFLQPDFAPRAPSSRPCFSCNKQPVGVLELAKLQRKQPRAPEQVIGFDLLERDL
jgi:hypothetical protein